MHTRVYVIDSEFLTGALYVHIYSNVHTQRRYIITCTIKKKSKHDNREREIHKYIYVQFNTRGTRFPFARPLLLSTKGRSSQVRAFDSPGIRNLWDYLYRSVPGYRYEPVARFRAKRADTQDVCLRLSRESTAMDRIGSAIRSEHA